MFKAKHYFKITSIKTFQVPDVVQKMQNRIFHFFYVFYVVITHIKMMMLLSLVWKRIF